MPQPTTERQLNPSPQVQAHTYTIREPPASIGPTVFTTTFDILFLTSFAPTSQYTSGQESKSHKKQKAS